MVNVQYDDPAFYIFAISMLGVYAVPATYFALGKLLNATVFQRKGAKRRLLAGEEAKSKRLKAEQRKALWSTWFILQLISLVIVWILLFILLSYYSSGGYVANFCCLFLFGMFCGCRHECKLLPRSPGEQTDDDLRIECNVC